MITTIIIIISIVLIATAYYVTGYRYSIREKLFQQQLKREITQNISHELKTPLASILGYIESIIENPELPKEKVDYFLNRTHQQAKRLQNLLDDIAVLNKLDEKKSVYEFDEVSINEVISEVLEDVGSAMTEKGITCDCNIAENSNIIGNRSLIYSIFRNLFDNAIAYAGEGVHIRVKLESGDGKYFRFSFSDNGIGIAKKHLARIFERFYRVEKGRSRKSGGTGLGLAIVKNAVLFHHGSISAENIPTGGVVFKFTIRKS